MTSGVPAKRKRSSGFPLDSDDEESAHSETEVSKRAKLVTEPPQPLDLTASDDPTTHPVLPDPVTHPVVTHVVTTHPLPTHPEPGEEAPTVPETMDLDPPPVVPVPVLPHLIASTGRGLGAIDDTTFNTTHEIDYEPLNEAADAVRADPSDKQLSEALGEEGAVAYLRAHTGHFDIELHHATPENPHQLLAVVGQRWSHAVAFNAAHVADISYWDGAQFHVIEAKGGGSQLNRRNQTNFHEDTTGDVVMAGAPGRNLTAGAINNLNLALFDPDGTPKTFNAGDGMPYAVKQYLPIQLTQGTRRYLTDIAHTMSRSTVRDGRDLVGQAILDNGNNVHYQAVSSQVAGAGVDVHTS